MYREKPDWWLLCAIWKLTWLLKLDHGVWLYKEFYFIRYVDDFLDCATDAIEADCGAGAAEYQTKVRHLLVGPFLQTIGCGKLLLLEIVLFHGGNFVKMTGVGEEVTHIIFSEPTRLVKSDLIGTFGG